MKIFRISWLSILMSRIHSQQEPSKMSRYWYIANKSNWWTYPAPESFGLGWLSIQRSFWFVNQARRLVPLGKWWRGIGCRCRFFDMGGPTMGRGKCRSSSKCYKKRSYPESSTGLHHGRLSPLSAKGKLMVVSIDVSCHVSDEMTRKNPFRLFASFRSIEYRSITSHHHPPSRNEAQKTSDRTS